MRRTPTRRQLRGAISAQSEARIASGADCRYAWYMIRHLSTSPENEKKRQLSEEKRVLA